MRNARIIVVIVIAIVSTLNVLAIAGCADRSARAASSTVSARAVEDQKTRNPNGVTASVRLQRPCALWWDGTTSVDPASRTAVVNQLTAQLPSVALREHVESCEVYEFGERPWAATPFYTLKLPHYVEAVFEEPLCIPPQETETSQWFRGAHERIVKRAAAACREKRVTALEEYQKTQKAAQTQYEKDLAQRMTELKRVLFARAPLIDQCTSITDLFTRIARSRGPLTVIPVTDAIETCRPALAPVEPPKEDVRVVVVLVDPTKRATVTLAEDFDRRRLELVNVAPWVRIIVPVWRFDTLVFENTTGGEEPATAKQP